MRKALLEILSIHTGVRVNGSRMKAALGVNPDATVYYCRTCKTYLLDGRYCETARLAKEGLDNELDD